MKNTRSNNASYNPDSTLKFLMLGDSKCGKSTIVSRYKCLLSNSNYIFDEEYKPTIIEENDLKLKSSRMTIVDTSGGEKWKNLCEEQMESADGFLVFYSIDSINSFHVAEFYLNMIKELVGEEQMSASLIATKCDLPMKEEEVDTNKGALLALKYGIPFVECSAKTNFNIPEIFESLYNRLFESWKGENWPLSCTPAEQTEICRTLENSLGLALNCHGPVFTTFFYGTFLSFLIDTNDIRNKSWLLVQKRMSVWDNQTTDGGANRLDLPISLGDSVRSSGSSAEIASSESDDFQKISSKSVQSRIDARQRVMYANGVSSRVLDRSMWKPKDAALQCRNCFARFTWPMRLKHHCRACGEVFCAKCSKYRAKMRTVSGMKKQRLCKDCHEVRSQNAI